MSVCLSYENPVTACEILIELLGRNLFRFSVPQFGHLNGIGCEATQGFPQMTVGIEIAHTEDRLLTEPNR